ncbi:hypothetical protein FXO37_18018 [Capsicum annuum]|nr:hypothetical protein FXO37_18018 [Capsicum annuum]
METEQQLSLKLFNNELGKQIIITLVYARCDSVERVALWDSMHLLGSGMSDPWLVAGDFNVIVDEEEKYGGLPVSISEVEDFRHCIQICNLSDLGFKGSIFTWWNGRTDEACIFKRLDRCLGNFEFQQMFPERDVTHLIRFGSDHSPLLLECKVDSPQIKKSFKFLNFWTTHESFLDVVHQNWNSEFADNPFVQFNLKLKKMKKILSSWSKATYGDIFQKIANMEDVIMVLEVQFELDPSRQNRQSLLKAQAELTRVMHIEEEFWKQKENMSWFQEIDRNSRFFHAQVKGRRRRMQIKRIQQDGQWLESTEEVANAAVNFFQKQFIEGRIPSDFDILKHVPSMINMEQNEDMVAWPTKKEVKNAVFGLNGDRWRSRWLYWKIVPLLLGNSRRRCVRNGLSHQGKDEHTHERQCKIAISYTLVHVDDERVTNKPLSVSCSLPTHEYIDSLPLVDNVNVLRVDMRVDTLVDPIDDQIDSSSKIDLCPPSVEAIMLNESTSSYENCIDQLMCKTCPLLDNMCDMINESQVSEEFENVGQEKRNEPVSLCCCKDSNVCLAHRVNRMLNMSLELDNDSLESESSKSVRGLDHLLFRYNVLFKDSLNTPNRPSGENDGIACIGSYSIYANPLWCDNIPLKDENLFLEDESTLKVKECVVLETTSSTLCDFSEDTIVKVELSATFLYSLFTCDDMYANVESRPSGCGKDYGKWQAEHVILQSMPIHLLSAVDPPDYAIEKLHKIFAQFFWSNSVGDRSRHWAKWLELCLPQDEGGLGFRSMFDVSKALFAKLWNFRTKPSLWSAFMSNKYSKKINPVIVLWKEGSHVWRKMLEARDLIEHQIYWKPRMGSCQFLFDNWTGLGALYHVTPSHFYCDESILNVAAVVSDNRWNGQLLRNILPPHLAEYIIENIQVPSQLQELDTPYWMLETTREFSVKSAWDYIRLRGVKSNIYKYMWIKGLPYKIAFMMWRAWKFKIPLDDGVKNIGFSLASRCSCCTRPQEDTFGHVFLKEPIAKRTWEYFNSYAVPAIIIRGLWKKRNNNKHREKVTVNRIIYQVSHTVQLLVKVRKPALKQVPHRWPDIIQVLEKFVPALKVTQVHWNLPPDNWLKCNTDGISRGNPGRSSYAFCMRDPLGDLIYAEAKEISEGTNTFSETCNSVRR